MTSSDPSSSDALSSDAPVPDALLDPQDPEDAAATLAPAGDELGVEVPEADALEQRQAVPSEDDDDR